MYIQEQLLNETLVVIPSYNSEHTICDTVNDLKLIGIKNILICDDASTDNSKEVIEKLNGVTTLFHEKNKGYGGNQKSLYKKALEGQYNYIVMVHGDHQYNPLIVPSLCWLLYSGDYDIVMGSRIIGGHPLKHGMPFYKYIANRGLTYFQNLMTGYKLSEYHSGLRAYKREVLEKIDFNKFSDDFIFDNQLLLSAIRQKMLIGEASCQTKFNHLTSSISFKKGMKYGVEIIVNTLKYRIGL